MPLGDTSRKGAEDNFGNKMEGIHVLAVKISDRLGKESFGHVYKLVSFWKFWTGFLHEKSHVTEHFFPLFLGIRFFG